MNATLGSNHTGCGFWAIPSAPGTVLEVISFPNSLTAAGRRLRRLANAPNRVGKTPRIRYGLDVLVADKLLRIPASSFPVKSDENCPVVVRIDPRCCRPRSCLFSRRYPGCRWPCCAGVSVTQFGSLGGPSGGSRLAWHSPSWPYTDVTTTAKRETTMAAVSFGLGSLWSCPPSFPGKGVTAPTLLCRTPVGVVLLEWCYYKVILNF